MNKNWIVAGLAGFVFAVSGIAPVVAEDLDTILSSGHLRGRRDGSRQGAKVS